MERKVPVVLSVDLMVVIGLYNFTTCRMVHFKQNYNTYLNFQHIHPLLATLIDLKNRYQY